jgi:hypothetical protein
LSKINKMTVTVELLSDDALDLLRHLEKLAILRLKKPKTEVNPNKKDITKLFGTLQLNMSIEDVDSQLKTLRNEWERDFS